ncbi:tRNA (adenine22-N1)-methyltransferase [Amphibacillus marinus]|uniref:tRNA (Adenine22-N1)-methyltransferase n=1 Tax=Amphibacillus marinus TaxID=872970 RepID=A0A1H8HHZ2_9BACI|nr:tRNA (adenine(22)-N(1))-methyltransferase TrmK [Amphibacillus marinus]SEN55770.1 tRNA (adenine22-N1)-methyltransferase [Amphibacillus marinus]
MRTIKLSSRLSIVAGFLPNQAYFVDVGSDHAYLPIAVCQSDKSAYAVAGELNRGPYQAAKQHVHTYGLTDRIEVVKGDGLSVITNQSIRQVVIAGMGGGLIRSILEQGYDRLNGVDRLILQPNVDSHYIRAWLNSKPFSLKEEVILEEDGHIYEVLVADRVEATQPLTPKQILFGPYLMQENHAVFQKKWKSEYRNKLRVINQMRLAKQLDERKLANLLQEVKWIEEVISHD